MDAYPFTFIDFVNERIRLAESIRDLYISVLPKCRVIFDRPLELGPKLVEDSLAIFYEDGSLYRDGKFNELVQQDTKRFLFAVRMPLVMIVRERYASKKCELWEMHELLFGEDKFLGETDFRSLNEPEDKPS